MNTVQRAIILAGVILVVLSGLFPAYEGEVSRPGDNKRGHIGHYSLFFPPTPTEVGTLLRAHEGYCSSHILVSQLCVQIVTTVQGIVGLCIIAAPRR